MLFELRHRRLHRTTVELGGVHRPLTLQSRTRLCSWEVKIDASPPTPDLICKQSSILNGWFMRLVVGCIGTLRGAARAPTKGRANRMGSWPPGPGAGRPHGGPAGLAPTSCPSTSAAHPWHWAGRPVPGRTTAAGRRHRCSTRGSEPIRLSTLPCAMAPIPAATPDDAPALDPPDIGSRDPELWVRPCSSLSVNHRSENAGVLVRPMITAPARRRLAMLSLKATTPLVVARRHRPPPWQTPRRRGWQQ